MAAPVSGTEPGHERSCSEKISARWARRNRDHRERRHHRAQRSELRSCKQDPGADELVPALLRKLAEEPSVNGSGHRASEGRRKVSGLSAGGWLAPAELLFQVQQGSHCDGRCERGEKPNAQHHEEVQSVLHGLPSSYCHILRSHRMTRVTKQMIPQRLRYTSRIEGPVRRPAELQQPGCEPGPKKQRARKTSDP